jgi:hypothetical protein
MHDKPALGMQVEQHRMDEDWSLKAQSVSWGILSAAMVDQQTSKPQRYVA